MLSFSIYLLAFVINLHVADSQSCSTNTQIANFQQLTQTLQIISSGNKVTKTHQFKVSSSYFDSTPSAITSIYLYNCPTFQQIDYRIDTEVSNMSVIIRFASSQMNWVQIGIIVWLNARTDIFSGTLFLQNLANGSSTTVMANTSKLVPFYSDNHTIYLNFINSISATSNNSQYSVMCEYASKTQNSYTATISTGPGTHLKFIKVDYMIHNVNSSLIFMYGGSFQQRINEKDPLFVKVHRKFAPIIHFMLGLHSLSLSQKNFILNMNLDADLILQISTSRQINRIKALFIFVGNFMSQVCSKCPAKYAYGDGCVRQCPKQTYPYEKYAQNGGASCLTCSKKVNEILNQLKTGCRCMEGYTFIDDYCIDPNSTNTNINGAILHNSTLPIPFPDSRMDIGVNKASEVRTAADSATPTPIINFVTDNQDANKNMNNTIIIQSPVLLDRDDDIQQKNTSTPAPAPISTANKIDGINITPSIPVGSGSQMITHSVQSITTIINKTVTSINHQNIVSPSMSTLASNNSNNKQNQNSVRDVDVLDVDVPKVATDTIANMNIMINNTANSNQNFNNSNNSQNNSLIINTTNIMTSKSQKQKVKISNITQSSNISIPNIKKTVINASNLTKPTVLTISNISNINIKAAAVNLTRVTKSSTRPINLTIIQRNQSKMTTSSLVLTQTLRPQEIGVCPPNMKFSTQLQKCQCDQFSIPTGNPNQCQRCHKGNYKNQYQCPPCEGGCLQCINATFCIECHPSWILSSINTCQLNRSVNQEDPSNVQTPVISTPVSPAPASQNPVPQNSSFGLDGFSSFDWNQNFGNSNSDFFSNTNTNTNTVEFQNPFVQANTSIPSVTPPTTTTTSTTTTITTTTTTNQTVITIPQPNISVVNTDTNNTLISPLPGPILCKQKMILINEVCQCVSGYYKKDQQCFQCVLNCQLCKQQNKCVKCKKGFAVAIDSQLCDFAPTCKKSQSPSINNCICNQSSIQENGFCRSCQPYEFKFKIIDPITQFQTQICYNCSFYLPHCIKCLNFDACLECEPTFTLTSNICICQEPLALYNNQGCCPFNFKFILSNRSCVPQEPTSQPLQPNNNSITPIDPTPMVPSQQPPKCKQFQQLQGLTCVCDQLSVNISGICQHCQEGFFKFPGNTALCINCGENCEKCLSLQDCQRCKSGHVFNSIMKRCQIVKVQPVNQSIQCNRLNQQLVNGKCQCVKQRVRNKTNGQCQICQKGQYFYVDICLDCPKQCTVCIFKMDILQCTQCQQGYQRDEINKGCCRLNQYYDKAQNTCKCKEGYFSIIGEGCITCKPGQVFNFINQLCEPQLNPPQENITIVNPPMETPITNTTIVNPPVIIPPSIPPQANCKPDQQFDGFTCQCKNPNLRMQDGSCKCPDGQFNFNKNCIPCISNCLQCNNSGTCNICQPGYIGNLCQSCHKDYNKISGTIPIRCQKKPCGNFKLQNPEECDDGNTNSNDGCSSQCQLQNGYSCVNEKTVCTLVTQVMKKQSDKITSAGIFSTFVYPNLESQPNFKEVIILNGAKPSNIKIIRSNTQQAVKIFLDYCGLTPDQNVTIKYVTNTNRGEVNYVSEYNFGQRSIIPRATISNALKQDQFLS